MNKNEKFQFLQFKHFIKQLKELNAETCLFAQHIDVKIGKEPYDAEVGFGNGIVKMVQLTQMSSVVYKSKEAIADPNQATFKALPPKSNNDKSNYEYASFLQKQGIKRSIIKHEKGLIHVSDEYSKVAPGEIDYEREHDLCGILDGLIRALRSKWGKYKLSDKAKFSSLVVIDNSLTVFYRRPFVNPRYLEMIGETSYSAEKYNVVDFLTAIFFKAIEILENEIGKSSFFDEIQVFFHEAKTSDSQERYFVVSTKSSNNYPIGHPLFKQFMCIAMNNSHKMSEIITDEEIKSFNLKNKDKR